jgi:hypothetical protein
MLGEDQNILLSVALLFVTHVVTASFCIHDLFTVSERSKKIWWLILILLLPIFSAIFYRVTMRRGRDPEAIDLTDFN